MAPPRLTAEEADRIIRKDVVEYLEVASSFEAQRKYERDVQDFVDVPAEVIEMWADSFPDDPRDRHFTNVFTDEEVQAVREFHATWLAVADASNKRNRAARGGRHGSLVEVRAQPEWEQLRAAAEKALRSFTPGLSGAR